ncbi:MAG: hypothetical protein ABGX16_12560 [Pirellulales bacterium]
MLKISCRIRIEGVSVRLQCVMVAAVLVALCVDDYAMASGSSNRLPSSHVMVAGFEWHTDYMLAYQAACRSKRMLLINFLPSSQSLSANNEAGQAQHELEKVIATDGVLRQQLESVIRVRLQWDTQIQLDGKSTRLLDNAAFQHLEGQPGIAIVDLAHEGASYYGRTVSVFPFHNGKYYCWKPEHLSIALQLPPGTITQRTMIWAVRIHPERPASTTGSEDTGLAQAAESHSQHQANLGLQGHHQWDTRFHQVRSMVGASTASEVVAESWPGQNMIDSCIDCVSSWRHSSGHWRSVRRRHRFYGYDIRRGRNGIWYGTGIFAN